jgi:hypothetical protein
LRAEGFFCNLDILYGGLGIGKLQFFNKKKFNFFSAVIFFQFLVIKALYPDWIGIRIGVHHKMLDQDPDPEKMKRIHNPAVNLNCTRPGSGSLFLHTVRYVMKDEQ